MEINSSDVATKVVTNLLEDSIKGAWKKVRTYFKDLEAKDEINYGIAYEDYLNNTKNKYSRIKTIIYRRVPKYLYDFYECIGVSCNNKNIDTSSVVNIINADNKIIITGTGGIGKSILLKHLYLNAIEKTEFIPVLIELRRFNNVSKDISLQDVIYENLRENGFKLEEKYFEFSMRQGGYIILLDGFDEVNRDLVSKVSSEIRKLCNQYGENKYILTSRPSDEFIGWNDFTEMSAMELSKEQALSLVSKIEFDENVKNIFYKELDESLYDNYQSFASNPLLLNIMLLTFESHASIPDNINDFYDQAFTTLYNMHDATKESYVRDIRTKLGCEDFKLVFSYICFKSYFKDEYEFSETKMREYIQEAKSKYEKLNFTVDDFQEDLTLSVCMLVKDGLNYRFSHRSFQEYFAAWYTCKLTDNIQSKLLTSWLKESNVLTDSYFTMLFNMQSEKVNKIILLPGIKELKKIYDDYGFSLDLLKRLHMGVRLRNKKKYSDNKIHISLIIKDKYLCYTLILICRLNRHVFNNESNNDEINNKLKKAYRVNRLHAIDFDEILKYISEEELLTELEWLKSRIEFALNILNSYSGSNVNKKKKVSSILDEI